MRIYSVASQSLFFVPFIDLKIKKFSPREIFYLVVGIVAILDAARGNSAVLAAPLGFVFLILGLTPFAFVPPEKKIANAVRYYFKKNAAAPKRRDAKKIRTDAVGLGDKYVERNNNNTDAESAATGDSEANKTVKPIKRTETVRIDDLDTPYTLSLDTTLTEQFVPVEIFIDDIKVASTATDRRGGVSCTVLIDRYGPKQIRVLQKNDDDDDAGSSNKQNVYERRVVFEKQ